MTQQKQKPEELSICEKLKYGIEEINSQLEILKEKRDELIFSKNDLDFDKVNIINETITQLNREILKLQTDQRRFDCLKEEKPKITYDNQNNISTASVRRKASADLTTTTSEKTLK